MALAQDLPVNWPSDVKFINTLLWDLYPHLEEKYEEGTGNTVYMKLGYDRTNHELCLLSEYDLPEGAWLDEYTGHVKLFEKISKPEFSIPYIKCEGKDYYIDATESGSLLRYMRKSRRKSGGNVALRTMYFGGKCRVFLEIIKPLKENSEIILWVQDDPHNIYKYIDMKTHNSHTILYSNQGTITAALKSFKQTDTLLWDKLSKEDVDLIFEKTKNLQLLCKIDTITEEGHPCKGEKGLFAIKGIQCGEYIGEYAGQVLGEVLDLRNLYLIDFSNTYNPDLSSVWIDAQKMGNETRFINDGNGIGSGENAQFKRIWVGGTMHVFVQATIDIKPGQEILVSYGVGYWGNLPDDH